MNGMIEITGVDLVKFVQKVYDLSVPQGLGFIHAEPGGLSKEEARRIIQAEGRIALSMDYVKGRACKMTVFRENGKLFTRTTWYDHNDDQFRKLLESCGLAPAEAAEHGIACNCSSCRFKRGDA